ncbi:transposase [Alteromonas sp. 345S023]|jgi:putative transposase|uniref:Transposase n=1 Tax=Alteromonas profundi TaxID=2696062 RepID=A0A7X5RJX2_9ALTE|nr:transposase [Alteromonas profundi]NDV90378.1 transposase [Alteromonas profundi]
MPQPRKTLICLDATSYYHCVSRCVRRAFLCGRDHYSGKSYEHRRHWVENRLLKLASVFAIDVCAYAVMSNHTHLVLYVDKRKALSLSTDDVLRRWHMLHKGTELTRQYMNSKSRSKLSQIQLQSVLSSVSVYRKRLYDISWFMRLLNEYIARLANKEDECTGRFWEGRFKSQALLDEASLLACMAYVDLNPIRAGKAKTPEKSAYTSIKRRVKAAKANAQPRSLLPFIGSTNSKAEKGLPFALEHYMQLVDYTGRRLTQKAEGVIPANCEPILSRVGINEGYWFKMTSGIETQFRSKISITIALRKAAF